MLNFEFHIPTHFVFGRDTENKVGEKIRELGGKRVLIHYGGGSVIRSGLMDRVTKSLTEAGLEYEMLGGVQPNPRDTKVYEGIQLVREKNIDFLLAVGGGSTIDSTKAIGTGSLYDGDFWDFFSYKLAPTKCLPIGVILTLAATGSESSNSCVITQESTKTKRGVNVECQRPVLAIMNPALTCTLPPYQTACGITDIMTHILERYFTNTMEVDVTDRLCEALLLTVIHAGQEAMKNPDNYDARAEIMWAGTLAHNNTCGVGREQDWSVHGMEHELSGMYDVAHGAGLAVMYPAWMRYTMHHRTEKFCQLAVRVWGCEMDYEHPERTALEGIERFEHFLKDIGMPLSLKELNAKEEDFQYLAEHTKRNNAGKLNGYFVPLDTKEIIDIFNIANR